MIDMAVGYQNRIEVFNICPKGLLAEIDGGIDENSFVSVLDQDRNSKAFVTRIVGKTCFAITSDRRYSG